MKLPERLLLPATCWLLITAAVPAFSATATVAPPALLEVEQAFQVSARFLNANTVELRYRIADGYYMYRERFKFAGEPGQPALGQAQIPAGKIKRDATFGRVETHRKSVRILLPVASPAEASLADTSPPLMLTVTSQGCADAGVCYPPQRHQFILERGSPATVQPVVAAGTTTFSSGPQPIPAPAVPASGKISDLIQRTP